MQKRYSRLRRIQKRKNVRNTLIFLILSVGMVLLAIFVGLPLMIKYTSFISDIRKSSEPIQKTDTTPPPPPKINPIPDSISNLDLEVSGATEPGATVKIFFNSNEEELLSNNEGVFSTSIKLSEGSNTINFQAIDNSGNESKKTQDYIVTYDSEPPELTLNSPENEKAFYGNSQRQMTIEGSTEVDAKIRINDRIVVVDDDGNFTYLTTLSEGENIFSIIAEDEAGNQTGQTLTVSFSP